MFFFSADEGARPPHHASRALISLSADRGGSAVLTVGLPAMALLRSPPPKSMLNSQDFARSACAAKQVKQATKTFLARQHLPAMASTPTAYGWPF